jgi:hypothetical protein
MNKKKPTKCPACKKTVPLDDYGRPRKYHKECRGAARSKAMKGNKNAEGRRVFKGFSGSHSDPDKLAKYTQQQKNVRDVAIAYHGELAEFSYWCYDQLSPMMYDNRVDLPLFQFCKVMPYGKCIASAETYDLDRPVINVFLSLWTRRVHKFAMVFGVIAHEMLHFDVGHRWRDGGPIWYKTSHANELWYDTVKTKGKILDAAPNSKMDEPYERWPHDAWSISRMSQINKQLANGNFPF